MIQTVLIHVNTITVSLTNINSTLYKCLINSLVGFHLRVGVHLLVCDHLLVGVHLCVGVHLLVGVH